MTRLWLTLKKPNRQSSRQTTHPFDCPLSLHNALQDKMINELSRMSADHSPQSSSDIPRPREKLLRLCGRLNGYTLTCSMDTLRSCKPIKLILKNTKSRPPAHIERWNLRLQEYHFTTVRTKGPSNPSDFLSRHPSPEIFHADQQSAELTL